MAVLDLEPTQHPWLDAAPFRAHVEHLMSVGSLTAADVAVLAGLPTTAVHHLVHGWRGRPRRRIHPPHAARLFAVTALEASLVRSRTVPSARTRLALACLTESGWSLDRLAAHTGLAVTEIAAILDERRARCPQLVELRVAAAARRLPVHTAFDQPEPGTVAA